MTVRKPILQALVLADRIERDGGTGKYVIEGTLNHVPVRNHHDATKSALGKTASGIVRGENSDTPDLYLNLTELSGKQEFEIRFVSLADHRVLFSTRFTIECDDPSISADFKIDLPRLSPPVAGIYSIELLWDNEILGAHKITAHDQEEMP